MKPKIALTFDDGPCELTPLILDILAKHNARAGFFVLGNKIRGNEEILQRTFNEGNEVISHSWSHCKEPNLSELSMDDMRTELRRTHELISETLGVSPPMFRPPYGAMSENLKSVAASMGLAIILWSVDTWDWRSKCPDEIYKEVFENIHENAVILCHDVHETTVIAMERVIPTLAERYELCTVSELMAHMNVEIKGGVIFPEGNIK